MATVEPDTTAAATAAKDRRGAAHAEFVAGMVRLGVWYVHRLVSSRRITVRKIADALTRRVNIYRLTTLFDGHHDPATGHDDPRWHELAAQLARLIEAGPAEELEDRALDLLKPWLATAPDPPPADAFGCWSYRLVGEGIADRPGVLGRIGNPRKLWHKVRRLAAVPAARRHAELHFFNASAPCSPFDDRLGLLRSLAELVADCRRRHPAVRRLWCFSWLNSREEFLALFPDSWRASAVVRSPEDVDAGSFGRAALNTDNWWGQFERRDGSLNEELAASFRASGGVFPFPSRRCHAEIAEVERHLATLLGAER